ncbi:hypothetical protein [Pontibacter rugosus]|uniref:Uncharacterized protein n=1 Tax=Pontibacter rugosus TaxID=1745966 RepID=A0ABW3SUC1_9BACT
MTIVLGKEASIQYSEGGNLLDTIPNEESEGWFDIDTDKKIIEVHLK